MKRQKMPSSPPLTPSQRQIWPHRRGRPQARGTELSTVPCRCTHQLGRCCDNGRAHQGPVQHHLSSGCLSGTAHTATEGAPGKEVQLEARPGQDEPAPVPGGLPWLRCFPFPCSHLGPSLGSLALLWVPQGAEPTGASTTRGKGWMHMPAPAAPRGDAFDITWVFRKFFSFGNPTLQKCNFLLDLPHAFERRHLTPASGRLLRAPWAFSEMSNPRRSPQHLQCFVTALAKC